MSIEKAKQITQNKEENSKMDVIHAYKGFNKDLTCRGFQYEEGKEYHTKKAKCCETGFHACEHPLDCLSYYSPNTGVYHEVELSGELDKQQSGNDSKVCATHIKIGARLSIAGLVKAAIDFTMSKVKKEAKAAGDRGASSATGYRGASSATGNYGASSATGYRGASSATGDCGASSATGYCGASSAEDPTAVAVAWGHEAKAKGCIGAHLVLSDWEYIGTKYDDGDYQKPFCKDNWKLRGARMVQVDGEAIKEDTYYRCINGEIVEVEDD